MLARQQELEAQVADLSRQVADARETCLKAATKLEQSMSNLAVAETEVRATRSQLSTATRQLASTREQLEATEGELRLSRSQHELVKREVGTLRRQLREAGQQVEGYMASAKHGGENDVGGHWD